jgi:succinate-acetate transporter protein
VGLYLWAWAIFTAYMTVASLRVSAAVALVFVLLTATYILLAIGAVGAHETVTHWGGYIGIATAVAAWYASFASVTNSTFRRTILPTIPLGPRAPAA